MPRVEGRPCANGGRRNLTCVENVLLGIEMGGDKGKDVQRDTVDAKERILQFTDGYECGRNVPFELRNFVRGDAAEVVSRWSPNESGIPLNVR